MPSRESSLVHNMVDGIFAVAITLIPVSIPNTFPLGGGKAFVQLTLAMVLYAITMLLIWFKTRTMLLVRTYLQPPDLVILGLIMAIAVMIPKTAYMTLNYGGDEGSFFRWSDAEWVAFLFGLLLVSMQALLFLLSLRSLRVEEARHYPRDLRISLLKVELGSLIAFLLLFLAENLCTGFNSRYLLIPVLILLVEEALCLWRIRRWMAGL
ncbi:MAG: hypothetical protein VKI83_04265 [Synechococcaceae cyanobacterium]|nr:hypothetical protein [Synechococcaceae cyanobacterium]